MNSSQRSFFQQGLKKQSNVQVCVACNRPIVGRVIWRASGTMIRHKRPYHKDCK